VNTATHLIGSPELANTAEYTYAAVVDAGSRMVFCAGACPLDQQGATVGASDVRAQAGQVIANLHTSRCRCRLR